MILLLALSATLAGHASAAGKGIELRSEVGGPVVEKIRSGKCVVEGRRPHREFAMFGYSSDRTYELVLTVLDWTGFDDTYLFVNGSRRPGTFHLFNRAAGTEFSNSFPFPPSPVDSPAGGVRFHHHGATMTVNLVGHNEAASDGVYLRGSVKCAKPRRK